MYIQYSIVNIHPVPSQKDLKFMYTLITIVLPVFCGFTYNAATVRELILVNTGRFPCATAAAKNKVYVDYYFQ